MLKFLNTGIIALTACMILSGPSFAAEEDEGQEQAQEDPNETICRRVHVTGTRIPQRYCFTRAEWTDMRQQREDDAQELMDSSVMDSNVVTESE